MGAYGEPTGRFEMPAGCGRHLPCSARGCMTGRAGLSMVLQEFKTTIDRALDSTHKEDAHSHGTNYDDIPVHTRDSIYTWKLEIRCNYL